MIIMVVAQLAASFTVVCPSGSLQCTVDGSRSVGLPQAYAWDWGDGRDEVHSRPNATNTWAKPGTYCVRLTLHDGTPKVSVTERLVTVPLTATRLGPCSTKSDTVTVPGAGRVDTVTIVKHDTIYLPPPPSTPGRTVIEPTPGEYLVYENGLLKGRLAAILSNQWQAYAYVPGQLSMQCLGFPLCNIYSSQDAARDALP